MKVKMLLSIAAVLCLGMASVANAENHPVKEAVEACQGKTENASCSFEGKDKKAMSGTCMKGPKGMVLACVPAKDGNAAKTEGQSH